MTYFVESPHSTRDCSRIHDELKRENPELLDRLYFSSEGGDHTAYGFVQASSEREACNMLPEVLRDKARCIEVEKLTPPSTGGLY